MANKPQRGGAKNTAKKKACPPIKKKQPEKARLARELEKASRVLKAEIKKRQQAEEATGVERQRFDDVLDTLPCYMVLLTPDYHVPFANKFFRERFGESHGRRCYEYLFNRTEPCEVCETYKVLKKMQPLEWEWTGPDGHNYYIYDFPFQGTDGASLIMEVGVDITVQKQALAELRLAHDELETRVEERTRELKELNRLLRAKMVEHRNAEEREKRITEEWQTTFDSITDMVSIQDKDCRLVRVNKAYADTVGMSCEQLNGEKCYTVVHHTDCPVVDCPHVETLKTQKSVTREIFEPRLGLFLEVTTSPIFNEAGELNGSVHIAKDITERKKAEEALKATMQQLRESGKHTAALLEGSKAVLRYDEFIDTARAIFDCCKDSIGATAGYVALLSEDGLENKVRFLDSGGRQCLVDPSLPMPIRGLRAEAYRTCRAVYDNRFSQSEWAALMPDKHMKLDNVLFAPLVIGGKPLGLLGLANKEGGFDENDAVLAKGFADIAAVALSKSHSLELLEASEARFREIFENSPVGIELYDSAGSLVTANRACLDIFGVRYVADVKGFHLFNDPNITDEMKTKLKKGELARYEAPFDFNKVREANLYPTSKSGIIYLDILLLPLQNNQGLISGYLVELQDITDRKKVEQMKDEFIGLVSHELRTPLTVITGSLRTALSEGLSAKEVRELIENATGGADQLAAILENMLELSRYQAGHLRLRLEPVSLPGTARTVINKLKGQGSSHQFSIDIPEGIPPVEADPVRVERIFYNLLENATKYSPPGSRISVSARAEGDFIVTAVTDQGPGISPEDQAKLFELFQQLETSRRLNTGAGLGLVVCKRLAEAQGGWIKVDSAPGKGSTFSFALPKSAVP